MEKCVLFILTLSAFCLVSIDEAPAQAVRGQVLSQTTGEPVAGAFVFLTTPDDEALAAALVDHSGSYSLRASRPGRYRLKVEVIGYQKAVSTELELMAGQTQDYAFRLLAEAIAADPLTATVRSEGTQEDQRRGYSAYRITSDEINALPGLGLHEVLARAVPGLEAIPSGRTGCPIFFYRGYTSLGPEPPPPMIVVDGQRFINDTCILNSLNLADIQEIQVMGLAGAAQWVGGTGAAAGMIRIKTKGGQ